MSDAGGFPEVAAAGAAECVPAGDAEALAKAIVGLLADPGRRARLAAGACALASDDWTWERAAELHLALYRRLLATA